jgi:hypothetical protein
MKHGLEKYSLSRDTIARDAEEMSPSRSMGLSRAKMPRLWDLDDNIVSDLQANLIRNLRSRTPSLSPIRTKLEEDILSTMDLMSAPAPDKDETL